MVFTLQKLTLKGETMTNIKRQTHKEKQPKRNIFILLTRFNDGGARLLRTFTGCYFTHASIGLEEDMNTFYSFVYKGFIVEQITRYIKPGKVPSPCELYKIPVCEKTYKRVKKLLASFANAKKKFSYTRSGVIMCLFGIPHNKKLSYFCSNFVAEILKKSGAANVKKDSALYFPEDLTKIDRLKLDFKGNLLSFAKHFGLVPCQA